MSNPASQTQELGQIVERERVRRGWSQQQLADRAGVYRATVISIETPNNKAVNTRSLQAVLGALELSLTAVGAHRHDYEEVCKVCGQKRGVA